MNDNQLQQLLQAINTLQDLGKVAYFNKGAYNSETTYEINDVVTYQGSSYVSLGNNNQGNLPTNATYWSVVALKGDKGETGKPFVIEKTYISIQEMVADYDNMNVNDYVMISGSIEDEQNATLWTKRETPAPTYKWVYLADFSGASGITGQTPNIQIGNVTEGNEPAVTRRQGSTNENPILDFVLKTGAKGDTGATGNGISQVSKTSTSGLTDTYTIEYTSGNSTTFDVTNGKGITSIAKTSTSGLVDTYTITYNDETTSTFTITNGEDGEVTQAQLDETNNQVAKANMVYNALPKVSDEGDSLTLDGTANCPMKMKLKGNTEQTTYTGKNLFDKNNANTLSGYVTSTKISSSSQTKTLYIPCKPNTTYTISKMLSSRFAVGTTTNVPVLNETIIDYLGDNTATSITITTSSNANYICVFYYHSDYDATITEQQILDSIQIEEGSTATTYEPYVGGTPSPNPDYPQDVRVVTGNNSVKVVGKNLLHITNGTYNSNGVTAIVSNGIITLNNTATANSFIRLSNDEYIFKAGTYTISANNDTALGSTDYLRFVNSNGSAVGEQCILNNKNAVKTITFAEDTDVLYLQVRITNGTTLTDYIIKPQLEEGSTATTYEPYQSQTYPINLGTMELCKIGDYQDYIYKDNGKWYKHSEIGKYVYNNDLQSNGIAIDKVGLITPELNIEANLGGPQFSNLAICNMLQTTMVNNTGLSGTTPQKKIRLYLSLNYATTYDEARTIYANGNLTIYYVLATPTDTQITDTTLISQLNAIENAVSYDTQTNIAQENYFEPFIINAECVRSLKDIFELIGNS